MVTEESLKALAETSCFANNGVYSDKLSREVEDYSRRLHSLSGPDYVPAEGSDVSFVEAAHIDSVLDGVLAQLTIIDIYRNEYHKVIGEDEIPIRLESELLEIKHSGNDQNVFMKLQKRDVVYAIYRNGVDSDYEMSSFEPYIVGTKVEADTEAKKSA